MHASNFSDRVGRRGALRAAPALVIASLVYAHASTGSAAPTVSARTDDNVRVESDDTTTEYRREVDGARGARLRVHVDSEALGGTWTKRASTGTTDGGETLSLGAGLARISLLDSGAAVFSRPLFGFGLGYVFADDRAVVGAKLALTAEGFDVTSGSDARTASLGGRVTPYFHWMFLPERAVRPYAEARVGFGGSATQVQTGTDGRITGHVIYPTVGAGGGVHFFPRDWFSVDVGLNVDYAAPFARTTYKDDDSRDTDFEKSADVVNFGILLGMSAWF